MSALSSRVRTRSLMVGLVTTVAALALLAAGPVRAAGQAVDGASAPEMARSTPTSLVWLVRHAERADQDPAAGAMLEPQRDPELSDAGRERAAELARMLADAGITRIWSTPFARTRQTAAPLAAALGLEVSEYDPRVAESMADLRVALDEPGSRHLVVGHSNTTPALVEALGADAHGAIAEDEYDRLYFVVRSGADAVSSALIRFGAPSH